MLAGFNVDLITPPVGRWQHEHGRKSAMLFCEALRQQKAASVHNIDPTPIDVYPCRWTADPRDGREGGPVHWHTGHRRAAPPAC